MSAGDLDFDQVEMLKAAIAAAAAASQVLLGRFRSAADVPLETWMKSSGELVTDADIASDNAIAEALDAAGVPGSILSEESRSERDGKGLTWLVDPLCGTVPFNTGMGHWGVNIGLRNGQALELGVLTLPFMNEQLTSVQGNGVLRNGRPWSALAPGAALSDVAVSLDIDGGKDWERLLGGGLEWVPSVGQINCFSSSAYSMAQICLGRLAAGVYYRIGPMHLAAGAIIAQELGLPVTDATGESIDWGSDDDLPVVVVGWPEVHAQLIKAMKSDR